MKSLLTLTAATFVTLGLGATSAQASPPSAFGLVDTWHVRYLGRPADRVAMRMCMSDLHAGVPVEVVEANVLASDEYFSRCGRCPEHYVLALYRDVLGEMHPCRKEVGRRAAILRHGGCRKAVALEMIREARIRFAPTRVTVVRPAPVTVVEPVYVTSPRVIVPAPVVRTPVYVPAPRSSFSLRIRF